VVGIIDPLVVGLIDPLVVGIIDPLVVGLIDPLVVGLIDPLVVCGLCNCVCLCESVYHTSLKIFIVDSKFDSYEFAVNQGMPVLEYTHLPLIDRTLRLTQRRLKLHITTTLGTLSEVLLKERTLVTDSQS